MGQRLTDELLTKLVVTLILSSVVLKSDLIWQEVDKVNKHIVAGYVDVQRIGGGADVRQEFVRSALLYQCNADASRRSP